MIKVGFLFLLGIVCLAQADNVPVLIYQKNARQIDNTVTIGQPLIANDFLKVLSTIKTSANIIVVDELNNQDLHEFLKQDEDSLKNVNYEPSVESAYANLKSYFADNKLKSNFKDYALNTEKALEEFRKEMDTSDVVILTGLKSKELKLNVERREVSVESENSTSVFGENCAAIFDGVYLLDNTKDKKDNVRVNLKVDSSEFTCTKEKSTLKLTVSSDALLFDSKIKELNLIFEPTSSSQYWGMLRTSSLVTAKESLGIVYMGAPYGMETPNSFSFVCTRTYFQLFNSTLNTRDMLKVSLYIENLQIQPSAVGKDGENFEFGKVNYCQGFFTSGIWMAIVASLLLTLILAIGVSFLFSINTMDRFDDPKGKQLNIAIEK